MGHPDKGQLPLAEVQRRLQPFLEAGTPIIVTQVRRNCPTRSMPIMSHISMLRWLVII